MPRCVFWPTTLVAAGLLMFSARATMAEVKLASPFSDNMVLQRGMKVPVWGTADPDDHIVVTMCGQRGYASVNAWGQWMAHIGPLPVGGPYELTAQGKQTVVVRNVLVGEVWVCSGQSNMQMAVVSCQNAEQEMADADYPQIRLLGVPNVTSATPLREFQGQWVPCTPETVKWFSGVGYFFGRDLHKALGVPVGLIGTSWGGDRRRGLDQPPPTGGTHQPASHTGAMGQVGQRLSGEPGEVQKGDPSGVGEEGRCGQDRG